MASRNTRQEAQELKEKIENQYPGMEIRITDLSKEREIPRKWLQESQVIVGDSGGDRITVLEGYFLVREARTCKACGSEILTAAIGEIEMGGNYCTGCEPKFVHEGSTEFDAYCKAEAAYYPEEGTGINA